MGKEKAHRQEKLTVIVGRSSKNGLRLEAVARSSKTGQFLSIREVESRPSTATGERILFRDSRTGSFATKKSTATIKSSASRFSDALASLAKK